MHHISEWPRGGSSSPATSASSMCGINTPLSSRDVPEPIAIVGMGDVNSPSQLWDMLINQRTGQCDVPKSRWNGDAFYHPHADDRPGSMKTKGGYFLKDNIHQFESSFFGLNNFEATYMDPQQRKLLEVVFECFENAGIRLEDASGAQIGCYVGNFTMDYLTMRSRDPEYFNRFVATGSGTTILANRISHTFNLKGPSMVIDTACSSSLFSLHTAVQAIRNGDCDSAVVAGVNLIQSPEQHLATMKAGVLSGTSTSHTFDSSADGYGRADGVGALFIKRLNDAIRDGDSIRSIIRGTAVNSNGRTTGITLPSAMAQEAAIRKAHEVAQLDINDTAYVECHGTGTQVGDPIEVEAVSRAFASRIRPGPLLIGGIKPNLGHSEAASGISAIIKASLALQAGIIPATAGVNKLNPKIKANEWNVEIVTRNTLWPVDGTDMTAPRRAGVSSFGYGGANSHVVLESPSTFLPSLLHTTGLSNQALCLSNQRFLLPFSASSVSALEHRVASLDPQRMNISDLAYTLGERRSKLAVKGFIVSTQSELSKNLRPEDLITAPDGDNLTPKPFAFVFTGQGAQWAGMGRGLIDEFPLARASVQRMDLALQSLPHPPSWTLREILSEDAVTSTINKATCAQPACTALQVVLVDILASWNINPTRVVGHSSGEIAASYAAGLITAQEAIITAYYRGYVVGSSRNDGLMMAVSLDARSAQAMIDGAGLTRSVTVACINSPMSVTLSGDATAIEHLDRILDEENVFHRKLLTDGKAYHSHHMTEIGQVYQDLLNAATQGLPKPKPIDGTACMFSSVLATRMSTMADSKYWRANLERPVLFAPALELLQKGNGYQLVELGPHAALKGPISQLRKHLCLKDIDLPYCAALNRGHDSAATLLNMVGRLFVGGHDVSFQAINARYLGKPTAQQTGNARVVDLPPYQWTYDQVLWEEPRASYEFRHREHPYHEILGSLIPGGNLTNFTWRNMLQPRRISWLEDHKLDDSIVFPAAGYIAMAVEALHQVKKMPPMECAIELHDVRILAALTLPADENVETEVFTTIQQYRISGASLSGKWWHFEIISVKDAASTVHATGKIRLHSSNLPLQQSIQVDSAVMEDGAIRNWYAKLQKGGLNFGPMFRSLESLQVHRGRSLLQASARASLLRQTPGAVKEDSVYVMHPITIDAMMQTGIMATAAGVLQKLEAQVPVAIEHAVFIRCSSADPSPIQNIVAQAKVKGFGQTDLFAEMLSDNGQLYASISNIRIVTYTGGSEDADVSDRYPMLRVVWKPDLYGLGLLKPEDFDQTLTQYVSVMRKSADCDLNSKLHAAVELISHKNPRIRVLYIDHFQPPLQDSVDTLQACLDVLRVGEAFSRCRSFTIGKINDGKVCAVRSSDTTLIAERSNWSEINANEDFDLIISPRDELRRHDIDYVLSTNGLVLTPNRKGVFDEKGLYSETQCPLDNGPGYLLMARKPSQKVLETTCDQQFIVVERQANTELGLAIAKSLVQRMCTVKQIELGQIGPGSIPEGSKVVVTVEVDAPLLSTITKAEMLQLKQITNNAAVVVWLTITRLGKCSQPDTALVGGLSRAIMLEQPSLRFFTLDLDNQTTAKITAQSVIGIFEQALTEGPSDYEFVQQDCCLSISRFIPDDHLNERFRQKQGNQIVDMPLQCALNSKLIIQALGQYDTLAFKLESVEEKLRSDFVEVEVRSMGLNAKDVYGLRGKVETVNATSGLEYSGIVRAVGRDVTNVAPGDRVVVMAPHHCQPITRSPAWACVKMLDTEDFSKVAVLTIAYSTAIYGLLHRGQLKAGESVLIHSGAGGVGIAAIQIAKLVGAKIFTTVGSEIKRDYLVKEFGIDPAQIFNSRDSSFLDGVLKATGGVGVDVVLNSLTGDLLHDSWKACAEFGRFVEIGKQDMSDSGSLNMRQFLKATTFTAFDLSALYYSHNAAARQVWSNLMHETMNLYRRGKITDIQPLEVFDVSQLSDAFRRFMSRHRMGKIAISLENPESIIKVLPFKHETRFFPEKTYLLVGCLGGLGGSIAKWMLSRGAKKLVFLGRSGIDRPAARNLVEHLTSKGAEITVARGDVSNTSDIQRTVDSVEGILGGVIHAAMGLDEALFTTMSEVSWHTGIDPKLRGAWNLHKALERREQTERLDFFLMTSSVSGSVGTATESNYCAANYFLDAFARYRKQRGLRATSLGLGMISEVGYLHENPEIEALLLRKGIQAIDQDELIQIVDLALQDQDVVPAELATDPLAHSHILTGLEPHGLKELRKKGFDGNNVVLNDPRAALLAAALGENDNTATFANGTTVSAELMTALDETSQDLDAAVHKLMVKKFSNLTLVQVDKVDQNRKLSVYGMDSMLAAEFRTWIYHVFKVDVPFFEMLKDTATLVSIIAMTAEKVKTSVQ